MSDFNDEPIEKPEEDLFSVDPFAKTISQCIQGMNNPVGSVVAINGPWGSGKSSVINLVKRHLDEADVDIKIISFQCWLYRSEDALAVGFFKELFAGLAPSLGGAKKAQKALAKLGAHVAGAGNLLGSIVRETFGSFIGGIFRFAFSGLENYIKTSESIEALQQEVEQALKDQCRRFLVIIDDLDRLEPEEVLVVFRLIKTVGRLPNVVYLLAYDRATTEKAVEEKFPSEGPHYLEKIVQAGFELPEPGAGLLQDMLTSKIDAIFDDADQPDQVRFGDLFYEAILPEMKTPRDVLRLSNALSVTWGAVSNEADMTDFIALETLRLFRSDLYRAIRQNKHRIVGLEQDGLQNDSAKVEEYNAIFLSGEPDIERERLKKVLMRLFPRLESVWGNIYPASDEWTQQRRVCAQEHFDTYFRFAMSGETVSVSEINEIIDRATESKFIKATFRDALGIMQGRGRTKASYLLDELTRHSNKFPDAAVGPFIATLFEIADELPNLADEERDFGIANNNLRTRWLMQALTMERFDLTTRSSILLKACENAALRWLADLEESVYWDYHPGKGKEPEPPENCLMTKADSKEVRKLALNRIRSAAKNGDLLRHGNLNHLLYYWWNMTDDGGLEVQKWAALMIEDDDALPILAGAFLRKSYSHGMGMPGGLSDLVYQEHDQVDAGLIDKIFDVDRFRQRLDKAMADQSFANEDRKIMRRFLDAWSIAKGVD